MSIQDYLTSTSRNSGPVAGETTVQDHTRKPTPWYRRGPGDRKGSSAPKPSIRPLLLCLAIALVVRAWLAIHTQGFIDGDEALVGIQAQHILQGQFPIYFYNQPYMGSLEAYLMAAIFAVAGSSVWTLRAEPILLSLVVVWLTWKLAEALADTARLPLHAKQWFMTIAALLAAVPPLYDTVLEMRMLGGYVEIFILMLLLLIAVLNLTNRRAAGAPTRELALRWATIGLLVGLGFWVNPLIIYGILTAALWILWDVVKVVKQSRGIQQLHRFVLLPALASIPACIIAMTPALIWGAKNQWQNFTYLLQLGGNTPLRPEILANYPTRLSMVFGQTKLYTTCVGPRVIGGALPGEDPAYRLLHTPTLLLGGACIIATVALAAISFARPITTGIATLERFQPFLLRIRHLVILPLAFLAATTFIFCATRTAAIGLWNCQYDLAGRYATPLMLVVPFFYAAIFTAIVLFEAELYNWGPTPSSVGAQFIAPSPQADARQNGRNELNNIIASQHVGAQFIAPSPQADARQNGRNELNNIIGSRHVGAQFIAPSPQADAQQNGRNELRPYMPGEIVQPDNLLPTAGQSAPVLAALDFQKAILGVMVGFLMLSIILQVSFYGVTDPGSTFQSPYCTFAPANNDAIIAYMEREHIHYAWANNWLAYPIVFKTHGSIILSDPLPIIRHTAILDRIPAYTNAVLHAERPSLLVLVKHNDSYPLILRMLDSQQVTYQFARFPAQQGRDVLVVTPLNSTVNPTTSAAYFNVFICSLDS